MKNYNYKYIVAAIYAVVLFLDKLDLTIVNIALPTIAEHFHVLVTETQWVNNAFLLALSISIPISSWLGDRYGSKLVFMWSIAAFGCSSFLCAFAPNIEILISMRFMQGLSSGLLVPIGMTMVFRAFEPSEYASISSYIFMPSLLAPGLAPMLGGWMLHYIGWRWVFLFVIPVCIIILVCAFCLLKEYRSTKYLPMDLKGFIYAAIALLLIFHFLSALDMHWRSWTIWFELLLALGSCYCFIRQEDKCPTPLIALDLFRNTVFIRANIIQTCFQIGHFGSIFIISIYLQMQVGYSAMLAGMIMGMQAFGAICSSRFSVKLFELYTAKLPISFGLTGVGLVTPLILSLDATSPVWLGCVFLFVRGLVSGLCGAPIQAIGISDFSNEQISQAAAAFNIIRQLAISLGIALSAVLLSIAIPQSTISTMMTQDISIFYAPFALISISVFCGALVTLNTNKASLTMHRGKNV